MLAFAGLSIGSVLAGWRFQLDREQSARRRAEAELSAVADSMLVHIADWRQERLASGRSAAASAAIVGEALRVLAGSASAEAGRGVVAYLETLVSAGGYRSGCLLDARGAVRLQTASRCELASDTVPLVKRSLATGEVQLSELCREPGGAAHLDLVVPLRGAAASGAFAFCVDAKGALFDGLLAWPTASASAEAILVRRDGDEVAWLSPLRHHPQPAGLRTRLATQDLPATVAALGRELTMEGVDYRGVPVLAVIRRVPSTSWALVAKVDLEEVAAEARSAVRLAQLALGVLLLSASAGLFAWWSRERSARERLEQELETARLQGLERHVHDIELIFLPDGSLVEANDRAVAAYGHTRDELRGMNVRALLAPAGAAELDQRLGEVLARGGLVYESTHRHRDGSGFPVVVSARSFTAGGRDYFHTLSRDVSQQKAAEERLRASLRENEKLVLELREALQNVKTLAEIVPICSHCKRIRDDAGYWQQLESYISAHTDARFSHGLCPECLAKFY